MSSSHLHQLNRSISVPPTPELFLLWSFHVSVDTLIEPSFPRFSTLALSLFGDPFSVLSVQNPLLLDSLPVHLTTFPDLSRGKPGSPGVLQIFPTQGWGEIC